MSDYHELLCEAKRLTGEEWIPYPSCMFAEAFEKAPDDVTKRYLIEDRRRFMFPEFMAGEPQYQLLKDVLDGKPIAAAKPI